MEEPGHVIAQLTSEPQLRNSSEGELPHPGQHVSKSLIFEASSQAKMYKSHVSV